MTTDGQQMTSAEELEAQLQPEAIGRAVASAPASNLPTTDDLVAELNRFKKKRRSRKVIIGILFVLIAAAVAAVLLGVRFNPVMQVQGDSMSPTLDEGSVVVALDFGELEAGDIIAFNYNDNVSIKRVIALPGDQVSISVDGTIAVNGEVLDEPYVAEKSLGGSNIVYPYQVPESHVFVLGDHRSTAIDSRNKAFGCVPEDAIIGKLMVCVWPLEDIGTL